MGRPKSKEELLEASEINFSKLWNITSKLTDKELKTEFNFSMDEKKKEAHWARDKNLRDVYIHLYEWHQLLLNWVENNETSPVTPFLPEPYTWKSYGNLNVKFWEKHQSTTEEEAIKLLKSSHKKCVELVNKFSDEELFTKEFFNWTGTTSLGSYCVSAMPSHYEWAMKKIKAHKKVCK